MNKWFKEWFALTDKGASDLVKSGISSFFVYAINLFPSMLLLALIDDLLSENQISKGFYVLASLVILGVMYLLLRTDYESLYNAVYKESANLRLEIADILRKLPLSYFSRHDLSDLSQTVMSDVESMEHAMSHAMSKVIGFFYFFPRYGHFIISWQCENGTSLRITHRHKPEPAFLIEKASDQ